MSGSDEMRVVRIRGAGGPEVLEIATRPVPEPGPGRIRVRVRSSGVNRADLMQREGRYPAPPGWPEDVPGLEYAGTVDAVGEGVRLWSPGDRVMGLVGGGGYSQFVVVSEREAVRVPDGMSLEDAGGVPEVFLTAWDALFPQAGLASGETLLVHAAGSGVGTAGLQMARAAGARTIGTSRTPAKVERALELGLDVGIVAGDDWPDRVLEATDGRGADVILDLVGADYLEGNQAVLAEKGRHVVVGVPSGRRATLDLRALMRQRGEIRGTVLRARPAEEKAALARAFEKRIVPLFEQGRLRPVVDGRYDPETVAEAHRRVADNRTFGSLVLVWE